MNNFDKPHKIALPNLSKIDWNLHQVFASQFELFQEVFFVELYYKSMLLSLSVFLV